MPPGFIEGSKNHLAYVWIVTWAENELEFVQNARRMLKTYNGELLGSEKCEVVDEEEDQGDELNDLVDRARGNPKAILYGTFHTYPAQ